MSKLRLGYGLTTFSFSYTQLHKKLSEYRVCEIHMFVFYSLCEMCENMHH